MKPTTYAVAVIVSNPENSKEFLLVKRPLSGPVPGIWGLPAATLKPGELPEDGVRRVGTEKLGCKIVPFEFVGSAVQERSDAFLQILDYKVKVAAGQPDVRKAVTAGTKYVDQKWTSDPKEMLPGATAGSLCEQIFLNSLGLWKKELIAKLLHERV
jgi:ADP-ribose pyrophosphatase YjhB (NUDIX family)